MSLQEIHELIRKNAKIPEKDLPKLRESLHGRPRKILFSKFDSLNGAGVLKVSDESDSTEGKERDTKESEFTWDRATKEALFIMYINAADPIGVTIKGFKAGDIIEITEASGIASFDEDDGNPGAASIVNLASTVAGGIFPEAAPFIEAGDKFAQEQFKATKSKKKLRDAFGNAEVGIPFLDSGVDFIARQEGGIVVCLPGSGGTVGSGVSETRWIKKPGNRIDENMPSQCKGCFFPIKGDKAHNTRQIKEDGVIHVLAWDHIFDDNAGFYQVIMHVKKGKLTEPGPVR